MYSSITLHDHIQKLENISNHNEKLYKILENYLELFPVLDAYLFRYSCLEFLGEGILNLNSSGVASIRDVRDDIRSLPVVYSSIRERKAKYMNGIEFHLKNAIGKYPQTHPVNAVLVTPICVESVVIGYICSTIFEEDANFDHQTLNSLTLYGNLVPNVLEGFTPFENTYFLSKREIEVMTRISRGDSTKEMADYMKIGEVTVNQYAKSAIKKIGAKNRSHAVSELLRKGVIT